MQNSKLREKVVALLEPHLSCKSIAELDAFFDFITRTAFIEQFFASDELKAERELIVETMSQSYDYW